MSPTRVAGADTVLDRLQGGLLGVAVGDALGATLEFAPPQPAGSLHTEISGGGVFGWAPGAPTDDTDLTIAVAEADGAAQAGKFTGRRTHRVIPGAGHNLPQEEPEAFAAGVMELIGA